MNANQAMEAARAADVRLAIDGDDLVLRSASPPPCEIIDALSRHKSQVIEIIRLDRSVWSAEDWRAFFDERAGIAEFDHGLPRQQAEDRAFECCVVEWLNRNPAPSIAGRCCRCGEVGTPDAVILPYGTEPETHAWLHAECWTDWQEDRRSRAIEALILMGLSPDRIRSVESNDGAKLEP
jgi:hypothetical protein